MEIKINWSYVKGSKDTKTMKLVCLPARGKRVCHPDEIDAELCISDGCNYVIAEIHTGDKDSSNALCEEIVRRFNEFPEELKKVSNMDKQAIKAKYNELVASLEDAQMYDGRGEYNGYVCEKCGYITATLYKDKGVTPFIIPCEKCGKAAMHKITSRNAPPTAPNISEVKNWVRPTFEQLIKMSQATIDHVLNGGLVFEEELKGL